ncbi:MAG: DNA-processing protein DprA [Rubripirellula sp.]
MDSQNGHHDNLKPFAPITAKKNDKNQSDKETMKHRQVNSPSSFKTTAYLDRDCPQINIDNLRLALIPGVGPKLFGRLLDRFGGAGEVLRASSTDLNQVYGIGPELIRFIQRSKELVPFDSIMTWCDRNHCKILQRGSPDYPASLTQIEDAPQILFAKGTLETLDQPSVAMVGTRYPTPYGRAQAKRFARELSESGITVVSGLARGIDGESHQSCMDAGGTTVAVLGSGLANIYPPEHRKLSEQIEQSGVLISEYPPLHQPRKTNFPQRNRIISGLSSITLVIEAPKQSGSLITARLALEQNREVMAIPGPISSKLSAGCHELIGEGAKLVQNIVDIIEEMPSEILEQNQNKDRKFPEMHRNPGQAYPKRHAKALASQTANLKDEEKQIIEAISPAGSLIDSIIQRTGITPQKVMATVSLLELRGLVLKSDHQKIYRK